MDQQRSEGPRVQRRRLSGDSISGVVFRIVVTRAGRARLEYVSPQAEVLFGQRPDPSLPDHGLGARIHPEDRDAFVRAALGAAAAGTPFRYEGRCTTPDGEIKWVQCTATATKHGEGLVYDGFLLDVTEARSVEAEVHRLSVVVEQMGDALLITDRRGIIQYVNPAFEEHLGYSRDEVVGKTPRVLKSGCHDDAFYRQMWDTVLSGRVYRGPIVNRHKDGRLVFEEKTISPVRDDAGRIVMFIATSKDVTAHRAAEAEARRAEERYRSFVANSSEGIWCLESAVPIPCDLDSYEQIERMATYLRLVECNDACARLFGRDRAADLIGCGVGDFLLPSPRDVGMLRELVEGGYRVRDHESTRIVGGERRSIRSSYNAVIEGGAVVRIWGVTRDVTAERRAAEALRAGKEELERRVAERTEALARANAQLARLATEDPLTGLANRRRFDEMLALEVRRARRRREPIALVMIDVDHFKAYNDHLGHVEGDRCLRLVGRAIRETFRRAEDLPARYGGEEFAVILPGTSAIDAGRLADRLRAQLHELAIVHPSSPTASEVTVSMGIIAASLSEDRSEQWLVEEADAALYRSKQAGRDQVTVVGA